MIDKLNTIRDLIIVSVLGVIIWGVLSSIDGFELLIEYLKTHEDYELDELLLLLLILSPFLIIYSLLRIKEAIHFNKQLKELNESLEKRVQSELKKREESEILLIQQSRHAALGEMISNIAHQWRQPLNALSLIVQNLNFLYKGQLLNDEQMERAMEKIKILTNSMSQTIDDFRNFFKPEKVKRDFIVKNTVKKALKIIDASFENLNIEIDSSKVELDTQAYGYENEFSQVLVNVLINAKDAIKENEIAEPKIIIELVENDNMIDLIVKDNAGGIPEDVISKVFDPYFSTKEKGTGIGLYMSKIIIEKNMQGHISIKNLDDGVQFIISLPTYKEK